MNTMSRCLRIAIALVILAGSSLGSTAAGQEMPEAVTTECVSVASDGTEGNNVSEYPSISGDGRRVAFYSYATNLVEGDTNGFYDVFVHDRQTGETRRVSVASDGTEGNNYSWLPSISGNGLYVVFESNASNLVSGDTNNRSDVFVHDLETGETTRASVASEGTQGDGSSYSPVISDDGRYVAFYSEATNLVSGDTNGYRDVFLHDQETGETKRVSLASDGTQGNHNSWIPAISGDGAFIAYVSYASNLVSWDGNDTWDVFVHEQATGVTTRASVASDGIEGNKYSGSPALSDDGHFVAFESNADNLVDGDGNAVGDIFVHDRTTGETTRVSVSSDGEEGNNGAFFPSVSADGRYVAFYSWASNLVFDDLNQKADIFIHDRANGETMMVSLAYDGAQGDADSGFASISADGRYAAFQSSASNLVISDTNTVRDIFVRDQGEGWFMYTISGSVSEAGGMPLSGVLISSSSGANVLSGLNGSYQITDVLSGTYTLTASLAGYSFTPISSTVSVPPEAVGVDFSATKEILNVLPLVVK